MTSPRKLTHDDLWNFKDIFQAVLSPDGRKVAFARRSAEKERNEWCNAIWLLDLDEQGQAIGEPHKLTSGTKIDANPVWSPDSHHLIFTSNREEEKSQLWLIDTAGGEARKLTNMFHGITEVAWSPDGKWVAFTAPAFPTDDDDVLTGRKQLEGAAKKKYDDEASLRPRRVTKILYRLDGRGLFDTFMHVFLMPAPENDTPIDPASIRRLTTGDYDHTMPGWTPDSQEICVLCNRAEDRDPSFVADLWAIHHETGEARCLTDNSLMLSSYSWAPDGQQVMVVGSQDISRGKWSVENCYLVSRAGGTPQLLLTNLDRDVAPMGTSGLGIPGPYVPQWSADGKHAYILVSDRGRVNVNRLDIERDTVTPLTNGEHIIFWQALLPNERGLVLLQEDHTRPWEFYCLPLSGTEVREAERLTHLYDSQLAEFVWNKPEHIEYRGTNDDLIDGWLIRPIGAKEGVRYPLITLIHGGPQWNYGIDFNVATHYFAHEGFAVFYCNPHGSTGSGLAFMEQVVGDWGGWDYQDIMRGVDECIACGVADPDRLLVSGYSYGGYMTSFIIGQTGRFKAAVPMAAVTNLSSFVGTSDIGFWMRIQAKGDPWDPERAEYYRERSPLSHAGKVTTPTLFLHPENDLRCPIEQSEQFYMALKMMGNVPVELVRIPSGWHGGATKPSQAYIRSQIMLDWFRKFVEIRAEEYE